MNSETIGPTCTVCGRHQPLPPDGPGFVERYGAVMRGWLGVWQGWFCPDHRDLAPRDEDQAPM